MCRAGHTHIAVSIFTLNKLPSGQANNVLFCSFVKVREDQLLIALTLDASFIITNHAFKIKGRICLCQCSMNVDHGVQRRPF